MLSETLRSRWFSACLHAGLWLLLVMTVAGLGGRHARFSEADADPIAVQKPVPVAKLDQLYVTTNRVTRIIDPASQAPFATAHFIPAVAPTPPPPTTRRVEITYQGYFQTTDGPLKTMLRLGDVFVTVPVGGVVVSNLWVASAAFKTLTLTNSAGQTNVVEVNAKQVLEVPLK